MIFNYINFFSYIIFFVSGFFIGIYYTRSVSNSMTEKFKNALNEEMKSYKKFSKESLELQIKHINSKVDYQDKINNNFRKIGENLMKTSSKIELLNEKMDQKQRLESEILKLKSIIKRLEKKQ